MKVASGSEPESYAELITATGSDGVVTKFTTFKRGKDERYTIDAGPIHTESGTLNGEDWNQNANGITVVNEPDPSEKDAASSEAAVEANATIRASGTLSDGLVVADVDATGNGTRRFVDPQTFHTMRFERVRRNAVSYTITYDAYEVFGSQTLASRWTVTRASGDAVTYVRVQRIVGGVSEAQVREPGIRRQLVDFPDTKPVEIPSHYDAGQYFLRLRINGHPVEFELDTGSDSITIDTDVAKRIGLSLINRRAETNAAAADAYSAAVSSIEIGPVKMHDIIVDTAPVRLKDTDHSEVAGLLGFDFLATIGLKMDNEHQRLIATPPAAIAPPTDPNAIPIDIRLGSHVPMMSVMLDTVVADRFIVDTGNGFGSYVVFDYFMNRHPNAGERSSQAIPGEGVGGAFTARPIFFHSFRFGTYNFTDFAGYRIGNGSFPQSDDGLVGPLFLVLFNVDFDYPHGRMYLTPTTNTKQMLHLH